MKLYALSELAPMVAAMRAEGRRVVFTNGCFDILHAGHVTLLAQAKALGDFLVVGINSDASVRRLKGPTRPIHDQEARATVLGALAAVDAVVIFEEQTPIETLEVLRPSIHAKGGDYTVDQLPEAATVQSHGGEIHLLPLVPGLSTSIAEQKLATPEQPRVVVMIPARYGSTRFPGKPLVDLGGQTVIERVVRAVLATQAERPVVVATDDERISAEIGKKFAASEAIPIMTSEACHTGTDRLAEATRLLLGEHPEGRTIVVNVQGDEPFLEPDHLDALVERMLQEPGLKMATLATPLENESQQADPNVVKVVLSRQGHALYFSRAAIPLSREGAPLSRLRHLGLYAYEAEWLLQMANLPPTELEEVEKLEQLRALEHGVQIGVAVVQDVVSIAIDTPQDLERARQYLATTQSS